jgi:hypothetical protein
MRFLKNLIAFLIGKFLLFAMLKLGKNGYHIPGAYAYKISKTILSFIDKPKKVIMVTGTNGKSTTTYLIKHILETSGKTVIFNTESNTQPGIISALLKNTTLFNKTKADSMVLEVAEESMNTIPKLIKPDYLIISNIQEDTSQVNVSPSYIYERMLGGITKDTVLILNNEDAHALSFKNLGNVYLTYGVDYTALGETTPSADGCHPFRTKGNWVPASAGMTKVMHPEIAASPSAPRNDSGPCPVCSFPIVFDCYKMSNIGDFHCSNCSLASEKVPSYCGANIDFNAGSFTIGNTELPFHYKSLYFIYNYTAAYALANSIGIDDATISKAFDSFTNIQGRLENLKINGIETEYVRFKQDTPDTLQSAIDYVGNDNSEMAILFSLNIVENHNFPRTTNTYYAWQCNYDSFKRDNVKKIICAGETTSYDTANLLKYNGVAEEKIEIINTDNPNSIIDKLGQTGVKKIVLFTLLHQYKEIRKVVNNEK